MNIDTGPRAICVARQHLLNPAPERRRRAPGAERDILARACQIVMAARRAADATLNWLARLPFDSRDHLHSQEHKMAMLGLRWDSDPAHDEALAQEIEIARLRRLASADAPGDAA